MSEQAVFDTLKYHIEVDTSGTRWYRNAMGQLHRDDGPAVEYTDGRKMWYQNGLRHRTDGPAIEWNDGGKGWFKDGQLHRTDGPAVEYPDGTKEWWLNDRRLAKAEFNQRVKRLCVNKKFSMH